MRKHKPISFDDLLVELKGQKTAQEEPGHVTLSELFNPAFMRKHSKLASFEDFLEKGNFQASTHEEISNLNDELFDRHVARETDFADWATMLETANKEIADRS